MSSPLNAVDQKYFYPDYQNYYYLIYEDHAIHKSVGQYVEKAARRQASPKNCYTRVPGLFLPVPPGWQTDGQRLLKASPRDKTAYIPCQEELFPEPGEAGRYLAAILAENGLM